MGFHLGMHLERGGTGAMGGPWGRRDFRRVCAQAGGHRDAVWLRETQNLLPRACFDGERGDDGGVVLVGLALVVHDVRVGSRTRVGHHLVRGGARAERACELRGE